MEGRRQGTASQENDESNCAAGRAPDRITIETWVTFGTQLSSQNIASILELTSKGDFRGHHFLFTLRWNQPGHKTSSWRTFGPTLLRPLHPLGAQAV